MVNIMGGNALSFETKRLSKNECDAIYDHITTSLLNYFGDIYDHILVRQVDAYRAKATFGDLDILVLCESTQRKKEILEFIRHELKPKEIVLNGDVVSFDVNDFQVDFILMPDVETFYFSTCYFSWNDLGNFIGRTAHRLGFKYGHDGLKYVVRDEDDSSYVISEVFLTKDHNEALEFLGFDSEVYSAGFDTPEEIFEYAASSRYFSAASFMLSNRNHVARVRDRKRKMYNMCVEYYKEKFGVDENTPVEPLDKAVHLLRAFDKFPSFYAAYTNVMAKHIKNKAYKSVFNGLTVGAIYCVEGKELGVKMKILREFFESFNLQEFVSSLSDIEFEKFVLMLEETGKLK